MKKVKLSIKKIQVAKLNDLSAIKGGGGQTETDKGQGKSGFILCTLGCKGTDVFIDQIDMY